MNFVLLLYYYLRKITVKSLNTSLESSCLPVKVAEVENFFFTNFQTIRHRWFLAQFLRLYSETKLILDSNSSKYPSSVVGVGLTRV